MSLPSIDALTAGKRFRASVAALVKNDMKPSLIPWRLTKLSWYCLRSSMMGAMLTSLKVVSIAAVCCASTRRLAMLARRRVIGTRFSARSPWATFSSGMAAGLVAAGAPDLLLATWFCTSSFVTRPSLPVPLTALGSMLFSSASLRAAGLRIASPEAASEAASAFGASALASALLSAGFASPAAPSLKRPMTSPLSQVSPSPFKISSITPSAGATTSSTTLSVSISTISSSREQASPGCLCQVATVPSATDSGKTGALISVDITDPEFGSSSDFERVVNQLLLLFDVHRHEPTRWSGRSLTTGILKIEFRAQALQRITHMVLTAIPGALVHRLFLTPDRIFQLGVLAQDFIQIVARERIELLNAHNGHIVALIRLFLLQKIIVDLAAAHDDAGNLLWIRRLFLRQNSLERARSQVIQAGDCLFMAQQTLRCNRHQRLAQRAFHLATQHMEDLRWRCRYANLDVVLRTQLQESFQARRAVLRPLPFIAVGQQQSQAA